MSKIPPPSARGAPPKTGGRPRPSETFRPTASSTMREAGSSQKMSKSSLKKPCPGPKEKKKKETDFILPALSTLKKSKVDVSELDRLKQKTLRRNAPEGEDLKMIKEIMKGVKDQEITVHEFVGLVAPYTGDNGTVLRTVLAAELSLFRTLSRKIYDNMTQDVSDVLTNEHIQLTESSKERHAAYSDKMMRAIDEIYEYCPNFDFEKYYTDPDYLEKLLPSAAEVVLDEDQEQIQLRQEAYHRMMWLRSEGDRLVSENKRLHARLKELKQRQKDEMKRASMIDKKNEEKRLELENQQENLQDQLEEMNVSLEKVLVEHEVDLHAEALENIPPPPEVRKPPPKAPKARLRGLENWNVKAAAEIEETSTTEALVAEASRVSIASSKSSGAIPKSTRYKKPKKKKLKPPSVSQDSSPFHYSPPRTPPEMRRQQQQQTSPFHYSPPPEMRRQEQQQTSPFHYSPPRAASRLQGEAAAFPDMETTRITTTTRTIEQPPTQSHLPRPRRSLAPQDSWRGFM